MKQISFETIHDDYDRINASVSVHCIESMDTPLIFAEHYHDHSEMIYVNTGFASIHTPDFHNYLPEGSLTIVDTRSIHSVEILPNTNTLLTVIKFAPDILSVKGSTSLQFRYYMPFFIGTGNHIKTINSNQINNSDIPELIREILKEVQSTPYGYELSVQINISRILLCIIRNFSQIDSSASTASSTRMNRNIEHILNYIYTNYADDITAEMVAMKFHLSYSHFCRTFRETTGKTFTEFLNHVRISESENLLQEENISITDVAIRSGFADSNYFIRKFRQSRGVSPGKFRELLMKS